MFQSRVFGVGSEKSSWSVLVSAGADLGATVVVVVTGGVTCGRVALVGAVVVVSAFGRTACVTGALRGERVGFTGAATWITTVAGRSCVGGCACATGRAACGFAFGRLATGVGCFFAAGCTA